MRWIVALVLVVGCKYPDPGFGMPADDEPGDDADVEDGMPDDEAVTPPCREPGSIDNMVELPGKMVAGFSPADDESFAISWLPGDTLGYTEGALGQTYSPTDLSDAIREANLSPDGETVYFFVNDGPAGMRLRRSSKIGSPATWSTPIWSGLPEGFPGRPTADDQRMFFDADAVPVEAARMAGTWMIERTYNSEDFGNDAASTITSGNLSPDGNFLLYTLSGPDAGIHLRVRVGGTFDVDDGAYGRGLATGTYYNAVIAANCTRLYAYNTTTQHVERWDVHPP